MSVDPVTGIVFLTCVLLILWLLVRRPSGLPPGPQRLPLLGNLLSMQSDFRITFRSFRQKYGDIYSVYIFNKPVIVLNGYTVIKDALVRNGEVFSDRPHSFVLDHLAQAKGILNTSGLTWTEQRKFTVSTLRELGVGRSVIEDKIKEEITELQRVFEEEDGHPFDCGSVLHNAVSNIISSVIFGKRFEYSDPLFKKLLYLIIDTTDNMLTADTLNMLPLLRYLPGDLFKFRRILRNDEMLQNELIKPSIEQHLQHGDDGSNDDFISAYIKEMRRRRQQGTDTSMNLENLQRVITDLYAAGTGTAAMTLRWAILYFLNYPDVQEKCFQEIKNKIGLNRLSSMKDKTALPYLEATILEVMRHGNVAPISVAHTVPYDVQFHGFTLPKGVAVIPNLDSIMQDPDVWGDPDNFRPDRFIDDEGRIFRKEEFIPFCTGRRACPGESFTRMTHFLLLAFMVQRFQFLPEAEVAPSMDGIMGAEFSPKPFKVRVVSRT